jgi:hypothetical protein
MKLPAAAIAAAFAVGIAIGLNQQLWPTPVRENRLWPFYFAALALIASSMFTLRNWSWLPGFVVMPCWVSLGLR